ncbi:MAG: hypothetical protein ACKPJJ_09695, partial [Planctomycetaceae bacterium]
MKGFSVLPAVRLAAMIAVVIASQAQQVTAGDCGCRRPAPLLPFAHAAVLPTAIPMPVLMPGCPCAGGMRKPAATGPDMSGRHQLHSTRTRTARHQNRHRDRRRKNRSVGKWQQWSRSAAAAVTGSDLL